MSYGEATPQGTGATGIAPTRRADLLETLRDRGRWYDAGLFLLVPLFLLGVFALPEGLRRDLTLRYTQPDVAAAFGSHFVHFTPAHLLTNIGVFLACMAVLYAAAVAAGRRRELLGASVLFLVVLPVVLSGLNVAIPRDRIGYGFSGILMAFVGLLPIAIAWFCEARLDPESSWHVAVGGYVLGAAGIAAIMLSPSIATLLGIATATLAVCATIGQLSGLPSCSRVLANGRRQVGDLELVAFGLVVYVGALAAAFPTDIVRNGVIVNVHVHFLGFTVGFLAVYLGVALLDWYGSPTAEDVPAPTAHDGSATYPTAD